MKKLQTSVFAVLAMFVCALSALAAPVAGTYNSTDLGGQLMLGRGSTWRPGVNSGFPHVAHAQSWSGSALGTQWEVSCPSAASYVSLVDNRVGGVGTIVYTTNYTGGTFIFFAGGWPWGDGSGTLNTTTEITTVQYIMIAGNSTPVASRVNSNTSGVFNGGCALTFAIANGTGAGETPTFSKPATYPMFLDGTCGSASPSAQFGAWGDVTQITMRIDCVTETKTSTWGALKTIYR